MSRKAQEQTRKNVSKKAAEQGAKTAAKAGSKAASTGAGVAAGGGCAAVAGVVLIIVLIILLLIGLISFMNNMPDITIGKITQWMDEQTENIRVFFAGSISGELGKAYLESTAQYIENMGYDLQGYGFFEIEDEEDKNITYTYRNIKLVYEDNSFKDSER